MVNVLVCKSVLCEVKEGLQIIQYHLENLELNGLGYNIPNMLPNYDDPTVLVP